MSKVVKRTFSLTEEQAHYIDQKVSQGGYASGSEVVREGLRGLAEEEAVFDAKLRREVLPVVDRLRTGKEKVHTVDAVRRSLKRVQNKLSKAR